MGTVTPWRRRRKPENVDTDAARIARLQALQNRIFDLEIARGDATQDCLANVGQIHRFNKLLAGARAELAEFVEQCCEDASAPVTTPTAWLTSASTRQASAR